MREPRLFTLFFLAGVLLGCAQASPTAVVTHGKADLYLHPFANSPAIHLNGQWEYYPNKLLAPAELASHARERRFAPVPGSFNLYKDASLRLPAAAFATYRLELVLPPQIANYTLRIPPLYTASQIFVNGHLEAKNGTITENLAELKPAARMLYLQLPLAGHTEIVIQVANAQSHRGGITAPIAIASATAMDSHRLRNLVTDGLISIGLIMFGLFHIVLRLLRFPEPAAIFYGFFCLCTGAGRLFTGEHLAFDLLYKSNWEILARVDATINYLDAFFLFQYLRTFFPKLQGCKAIAMAIWPPLFFAAAVWFLPHAFFGDARLAFQVFLVLLIPLGFYKLIKIAIENVYGARLFLIGMLFMAVIFLHDILIHSELLTGTPQISVASFVFTILQAALIAGKSFKIFHDNLRLSQRLMHEGRLRDEFLEHTSHELRTPLQAMVQTIENIRRGLSGAVNEQVQKSLTVVEESGQRLLYLIDDLKDFIRLKQDDLRLNIQPVSLRKVIDPVLKLALGLTEDKNFTLVNEIPDGIDDLQVDPSRLQQILLNLIHAAIRYSHSPSVMVKAGKMEDQLTISVVYNGTAPDARYTQASEIIDEETAPSVVQRLAELMGGKYFYYQFSESRHALTITLPYENPDRLEYLIANNKHRTEYQKSKSDDRNQAIPKGLGTSLIADYILVIGDHTGQNRLLQEQLASLGKQFLFAKNGAEAMLQLQNRQDISLVICDVMLADVSGIELAMNIRAHYDISLLPMILVIDNNQAGVAASAFSAGVNDLIRRPFEKAELLARVRNLLLQREASIARENYRSLNRELEIAKSIQESLIPVARPQTNNYSMEAVCLPARSIGGDFYDFIDDENFVSVLIADVAGHGIPAALYAAMLKIAFHNLREKARFPEQLLKSLNDIMVDRGERTFISCAYTLVDFKNKRLLHANAGHLPLLVQEPGKKEVKKIQPPGGVLGVRKASAITVEMQHLQPQTRLVLFTDGVVEMVNKRGEFFDEERLIALLEAMREAPLVAVKEKLLSALRDFSEGESFLDDVTFVLLDV